MKFPWLPFGGKTLPLVRCGLRRSSISKPIPDLIMLFDTGADGVMLPLQFATNVMGFGSTDFNEQKSMGLGGESVVFVPKGSIDVEISIGGHWLPLPTVGFSPTCPPLLGRDVVFENFDVRMSQQEVEFRPKPKPPAKSK